MDIRANIDDQASSNNEVISSKNQETQRISVDNKNTQNKDDQLNEEILMDDPGDDIYDITIEKKEIENEPTIEDRIGKETNEQIFNLIKQVIVMMQRMQIISNHWYTIFDQTRRKKAI